MNNATKNKKGLVWLLWLALIVLSFGVGLLFLPKSVNVSADTGDEMLSQFTFTDKTGVQYADGTITISDLNIANKTIEFSFENSGLVFDTSSSYTISMDVTRDADSYSTLVVYAGGNWSPMTTAELNPGKAETQTVSLTFTGADIAVSGTNIIGFQIQGWSDGIDATISNIKLTGPKTVQFVQKDINATNTQFATAPYEAGFTVSNDSFTDEGVISATVNSTVGWSNFIWIPMDDSVLTNGEVYSFNFTYASNMGIFVKVGDQDAYLSYSGIEGEKTVSYVFTKGEASMGNIVIEAFPTVGEECTFTMKNIYIAKDVKTSVGSAFGTLPTVPAKEHYTGVWKIDGAEVTAETVLTDGMSTVARITYTESEHVLTKVDGQAATCLAEGWKDYYTCANCNGNFTLNAGETLGENGVIALDKVTAIADVATWKTNEGKLDILGHNYGEEIAEVPATCKATGTKAHYACSVCDKLYTKADGVYTEVTADDLVIAKVACTYGEEIAEVPATCKATGTKAHYACSVCDKLYTKADDVYTEVTADDLVMAKVACTYGEEIAEVPATCTVDGTKAHYACSVCGKLYTEADGVYTEVTADDLVIEATHKYVFVAAVEATAEADGMAEHYKCSVCNKVFTKSGEVYTETTEEALKVEYVAPEVPDDGNDDGDNEEDKPKDEDKEEDEGCGSSISAIGLVSLVTMMGAVAMVRRKKNS